jgi:hypothetical protein
MRSHKVSDKLMNFSAKIGVHPYHVSPSDVLEDTARGGTSSEDCVEFLDELDKAFADPNLVN